MQAETIVEKHTFRSDSISHFHTNYGTLWPFTQYAYYITIREYTCATYCDFTAEKAPISEEKCDTVFKSARIKDKGEPLLNFGLRAKSE